MHGTILSLNSVLLLNPSIFQEVEIQESIYSLLEEGLKGIKAPLVDATVHLAGCMMIKDIMTARIISMLIPICSPGVQFVDARREAIHYIKVLAKINHSKVEPFIDELVSSLMQSVRDRTIAIKLAAERALLYVLQVKEGTGILNKYLETLDPPKARSISEYSRRVLVKIADRDSDNEQE